MHVILLHFYSHTPTPAYQEIASSLRALGHTVWVGSRNRAGELAWHDGQRIMAVTRGPARIPVSLQRVPLIGTILARLGFLVFLGRLRSFLCKSRPNIVQMNHASFHGLAVLPLLMPQEMHFVIDYRQVGQLGATTLVGRLKGWGTDQWRRFYTRYVYERACFLHQAGARKNLGALWRRWGSVVPLGVGPQFLAFDHGLQGPVDAEEMVRFVYVGTLSRVRHLEQILYAVAEAMRVTSRFRLVFLGTDRAQGFYQDVVRELGLGSVVMVEPPVPYEEIPGVIAGYDVALAYVPQRPAHWQYHPTLKVLEYRALGLPIIASDNEPNRDVVKHGVNGLLVQNSTGSLAEAMLRFVSDACLLEHCTTNARRMRQGSTWHEVAKMYEQDVYVELNKKKVPQTVTDNQD